MNKEKLATLCSYGDYSNSNYGSHCMRVTLPASRKNKHGITIYFSYDTVVAFRGWVNNKRVLVVHKNDYSRTTGKHLNCIDGGDKKGRVDDTTFEKLYRQALKNA